MYGNSIEWVSKQNGGQISRFEKKKVFNSDGKK